MKKTILLAVFAVGMIATAQEKIKCTGTTKKGEPCKLTAIKDETKCRYHSENTPRCGELKKDGKACRIVVKQNGLKCRFH